MAVYQHKVTGDRIRPATGDKAGRPGEYERLLAASPLYELVDPEDGSAPVAVEESAEAPAELAVEAPKRTSKRESE